MKVGRIAGQFAKPRSADTETHRRRRAARRSAATSSTTSSPPRRPGSPNPERLLQAYHQSASTLNLLRAFVKGGFADLSRVHQWNQEFVGVEPRGPALRAARRRDRPGAAVHAGVRHRLRDPAQPPRGRLLHQPRGADPRLRGGPHPAGLAHRRLVRLLGPHALDRRAHPPARRRPRRVPPRRRQPDRLQDRPHRHGRRGARACARRSTPSGVPGRLTLISRMGADAIEDGLRPLLAARARRRPPVVWACDPMHGNTFTSEGGRKTRHLDAVLREIAGLLRRPPRRGHLARRRARRAHRRRRHRVPRRRRGDPRRRPRRPLRDDVRSPPQRPPEPRPRLPGRRAAAER